MLEPKYFPFYLFAAVTAFGLFSVVASLIKMCIPRHRAKARRVLLWGGVPALAAPFLVWGYVDVHLSYLGPIDDDLGFAFYLYVLPFTAFGLGAIAHAVHARRVSHGSRVA